MVRTILCCCLLASLQAVEFPLTAPAVGGNTITVNPSASGKPTLLVFWATWCGACHREMPGLKALAASNPPLDLIGVSIDESNDATTQDVAAQGLNYPVALDPDMKLADQFLVDQTPTLVLLDRDGSELARGRSLALLRKPLAAVGVSLP